MSLDFLMFLYRLSDLINGFGHYILLTVTLLVLLILT